MPMSFEWDWERLEKDLELHRRLQEQLNKFLQSIELPSYVKNLNVVDLALGSQAPKIVLKEITDPLQDFYDAIEEETGEIPERSPNDVQLVAELEYSGDLAITVTGDLVLNYPVDSFVSLPLTLRVGKLGLHSLVLITYLQGQAFISFLCDVSDPELENQATGSILDTLGPLLSPKKPVERISIIRNLHIETEIGEQFEDEGSTLRSIGKLEQYLLGKLKDMLRKEIGWPSWINLDIQSTEDSEQDDDNDNDDGDDDEVNTSDDSNIVQNAVYNSSS